MESIACLVLNYNDSLTTKRLVDSIVNYSIIKKIVIVDNHSTDNSYLKLKKLETEKIIVLKTNRNGGYGYGNNYGIAYIHDILGINYVLVANPDVEISENCIKKLIHVMKKKKNCVIVAPIQRLYKKEGEIVPPWRLTTLYKTVISASVIFSRLFNVRLEYKKKYLNKGIVECDVIQGALFLADINFMYNKKYDEDIFLYNEEECLAQEVRRANKTSYTLCDDFYIHHHSVSISKSINSMVDKKRIQLESRFKYIIKYYNVSNMQLQLIKLFFRYCIFEAYIYSRLRKENKCI